MNWELILTIFAFLCTLIAIIFSYYQHVKKKLEQEALDAINKAEETDKIGAEKMQDAIKMVKDMIPSVAKPFISDTLIETVIQSVFDKVEDYARKQLEKEKTNE
jgi:predicted subunit of tRNA(5-methylaminomethyl-2-thiouridylate) methyltransferase